MQISVYTVCQQFARVVKQVVPGLHGHRSKTLGWLVVGIMLAKSVASAQMAVSIAPEAPSGWPYRPLVPLTGTRVACSPSAAWMARTSA